MKKTHKLLILLALVCTLLVCGMMSASATKEYIYEGALCYTDDQERYVYTSWDENSVIGVTDTFKPGNWWEMVGSYYSEDNGECLNVPFFFGDGENPIFPFGTTFDRIGIEQSYDLLQTIRVNAFAGIICGRFAIPKTVFQIEPGAFNFSTITDFFVDRDNPYFENDDNGILYGSTTKEVDGEIVRDEVYRVVRAPSKTVDHIDIPDGITTIDSGAYYYYNAKTITIPASVKTINNTAFPCLAIGSSDKFDAVYYEGTIDQWNEITIGSLNGRITKAHLYCNDWYKISERTCTTAEIERCDCSCSDDCDAYITREIKPSLGGHEYRSIDTEWSTCSTQGYRTYECSVCKSTYTDNFELDPNKHEGPIKYRGYIPCTCCTEGKTFEEYCEACDVTIKAGVLIPAQGSHNYGSWYATEAPTCCQEGVERRDCTVGEAYETRVATPTGNHSFGDWYVTLEPTCAITGIERRDCTLGEAFETRDIPVSDIHTYGNNWKIYEPATCAAVGTEISYCTVCFGAPITREIPKTDDHSWRNWANVIVATCTTSGTEERVCNRCKATESRETEIVDHRFNGGTEVITEPTCRKNGTKEVKCIWYDQCGETELNQIRSVNHTYENYEVTTPATCINTGKETAKCKWYDECYTTRSNTIPATGTHIFDKPYESLRGQCDREGYIKYKCTADPDCTEIKTETLAVDPEFHNSGLNYDVGKKDVTCCADGYSGDATCIGCGVVIVKGEVIPATGEHVWKEAEIFGGNCKISGYIKYRCENGTAEYKEDLGINNSIHYKTEVRNYKAGNCQTMGYSGDKYCTHCNALISKGKEVKGSHSGTQKCSICGYNVCGCQLCHGNGFERFIMKMFLWIYKIFGQNKSCRCGNVHY